MKPIKQIVILSALALLLTAQAAALELTADPTVSFCFSTEDFTTEATDQGIFLTAVPNAQIATVTYGGRVLRAGDALPREALTELMLQSQCVTQQTASIDYYTVSNGKVTGQKSMELAIFPKKNEAPAASDLTLETYRNMSHSGQLQAEDPENGSLTYSLLTPPKRGTVTLSEDGSFTYTPLENKVGKDRFTFTVTDDAGNISEPATVSIRIKKPSEKPAYADMTEDPDAFYAQWLREEQLFTGIQIGEHLCFLPDESVSRGEFLVMVMHLVDAEASQEPMSTGFADEAETAAWLQPYLVSALRNGMISGISEEDGVSFLAHAPMTQAEAAVMVQNILQLPFSQASSVFSLQDSALPAWAAEAAAALLQAGINLDVTNDVQLLTRRDAARVLYDIHNLMDQNALPTFYWVQ